MASNALPLVGESQARNAQGEAPKMLLIADERNHQSRSSFPNTWGNLYCSNLSITCGHTCVPKAKEQSISENIYAEVQINSRILLQIKSCHHQGLKLPMIEDEWLDRS